MARRVANAKSKLLTGYTAEKPSFIGKCIHTFKCISYHLLTPHLGLTT